MKRFKLVFLSLFSLTVLVSCYWMSSLNSGSFELDLSGIQPRQAGDLVRVYLLADGLLFSTDRGVPFSAEVSLGAGSETRITIDGLPVGPRYQALVGIGPVTDGIFYAYYYGESPVFRVVGGSSTTVSVTLDSLPFGIYYAKDLMGRRLKGAVESGSGAYTAEESKLYYVEWIWDSDMGEYRLEVFDSYDLAADPNGEGVSSYRVNGLSRPNTGWQAQINSNLGVLPFYGNDGWGFDLPFSQNLSGSKDVVESGSFMSGADYSFFFRRVSGIGGTYIGQLDIGNPNLWQWVNVDSPPVLDMVLSLNNAYFATDGGSFALPPAFLQDPIPTLSKHRIDFSTPAAVVSLGFKPNLAAPGGKIFMGTVNGVWEANVDETSGVSVDVATQIPETAGKRIEMINISSYWPDYNQAYLSRYYLFIRYWGTVYKIPFFAVIPGKATGIGWDSGGNLYISGTEGLSMLNVGYVGS